MRTICNLSWDRSKSMVHIIDLYAFVTRSLIPCSILFDWLFQVMWLAWFFMTYFEWAGLNEMVQCISMILTIHVPKKILQHIHVSRPYILQMLILTPTSLPSMQTLHSANLNLLLAACCLIHACYLLLLFFYHLQVVITKCYHLFCYPCIQRNLEIRHRKCPGCGTPFGQNDVREVKIWIPSWPLYLI